MSTEGGAGEAGALPDADGLDALRRRVYGPDATPDDLARYRAAVEAERRRADAEAAESRASTRPAAPAASTDVEPEAPAPVAPRRRRRRALVAGGVALLVVVAGVAGLAQTVRPPAPAPTPLASPAALGVDDVTRITFIRGLTQGGSAGLGFFLDRDPAARPVELATATRMETIEKTGDGTRTVTLEPLAHSPGDGGRATVILVLAVDSPVTWTAYRFAIDEDRLVHLQRSATRGGRQQAGLPTSATFSFQPGRRPLRLRVAAPAGVRWDVAVVFTD